MAETRAQSNKRIRQDSLREQLSNQKHLEKVVDNIEEIEKLSLGVTGGDKDKDIDYKTYQFYQYEVQRLTKATELRLKLVNKYLPDEKYVELTGELALPQVVLKNLSGK